MELLSYFDSFLMYIDIHTKSQNFLKISMFSNKIFHSLVEHSCLKKSKFLTKFQFFSQKVTVLHKNWCWEKHSSQTPKFARHDFITVIRNSLIYPKTNTFCIKWYFLPKGNNTTWNWHFSKTGNTSLRKLNISTRN